MLVKVGRLRRGGPRPRLRGRVRVRLARRAPGRLLGFELRHVHVRHRDHRAGPPVPRLTPVRVPQGRAARLVAHVPVRREPAGIVIDVNTRSATHARGVGGLQPRPGGPIGLMVRLKHHRRAARRLTFGSREVALDRVPAEAELVQGLVSLTHPLPAGAAEADVIAVRHHRGRRVRGEGVPEPVEVPRGVQHVVLAERDRVVLLARSGGMGHRLPDLGQDRVIAPLPRPDEAPEHDPGGVHARENAQVPADLPGARADGHVVPDGLLPGVNHGLKRAHEEGVRGAVIAVPQGQYALPRWTRTGAVKGLNVRRGLDESVPGVRPQVLPEVLADLLVRLNAEFPVTDQQVPHVVLGAERVRGRRVVVPAGHVPELVPPPQPGHAQRPAPAAPHHLVNVPLLAPEPVEQRVEPGPRRGPHQPQPEAHHGDLERLARRIRAARVRVPRAPQPAARVRLPVCAQPPAVVVHQRPGHDVPRVRIT